MTHNTSSKFEIENPLKPQITPAPDDDSDWSTLEHFTKCLFYITLAAFLLGLTLGLTLFSLPLIINTLDQLTLLAIFGLSHYSVLQKTKHNRLTYPYGLNRFELISACTIYIQIIFTTMHFLFKLTTAALSLSLSKGQNIDYQSSHIESDHRTPLILHRFTDMAIVIICVGFLVKGYSNGIMNGDLLLGNVLNACIVKEVWDDSILLTRAIFFILGLECFGQLADILAEDRAGFVEVSLGIQFVSYGGVGWMVYGDMKLVIRILLNGLLKRDETTKTIIGYLERELGENRLIDIRLWTVSEGEDYADVVVLAKDESMANEGFIRDRVNRRMDMQNFSKTFIEIVNENTYDRRDSNDKHF
jgi:Co/Zn/Cd efflux system component